MHFGKIIARLERHTSANHRSVLRKSFQTNFGLRDELWETKFKTNSSALFTTEFS